MVHAGGPGHVEPPVFVTNIDAMVPSAKGTSGACYAWRGEGGRGATPGAHGPIAGYETTA